MSEYYLHTMENRSREATVAYWEWQKDAACKGMGAALFYHPDGERGPEKLSRDNAAKEVCFKCIVRTACLEYALANLETYGVWGGTTEDEREEMLTQRRAFNEA
jgi:WhiB family redox-sensing transcriptional regulator